MSNWISIWIYLQNSLTTTRIKVNGLLSHPVLISNGTCQSCLLSPILYSLTEEHLASALMADDKTQDIEVQRRQHKLSLFAGDLVLYVSNPWVVFPSILKELDHFGLIPNFNATKSQCLKVSSKADQECPRNAFPFSRFPDFEYIFWGANHSTLAKIIQLKLSTFIGIHPA